MATDAIQPFDWQRMFVGDLTLLILFEIAFRTAFMYLYVLFLTRLVGKRVVGDLTPFDYIIVIAIGSATGDPMLSPEVPLLHGMVVLSILVYLERVMARLMQRSGRLEKLMDGTPSLVVRDGKIVEEWLEHERMTRGELFSLLRIRGVRDLGEIERAYLEPGGVLSVFLYPQEEVRQVRTTLPPRKVVEDTL